MYTGSYVHSGQEKENWQAPKNSNRHSDIKSKENYFYLLPYCLFIDMIVWKHKIVSSYKMACYNFISKENHA